MKNVHVAILTGCETRSHDWSFTEYHFRFCWLSPRSFEIIFFTDRKTCYLQQRKNNLKYFLHRLPNIKKNYMNEINVHYYNKQNDMLKICKSWYYRTLLKKENVKQLENVGEMISLPVISQSVQLKEQKMISKDRTRLPMTSFRSSSSMIAVTCTCTWTCMWPIKTKAFAMCN